MLLSSLLFCSFFANEQCFLLFKSLLLPLQRFHIVFELIYDVLELLDFCLLLLVDICNLGILLFFLHLQLLLVDHFKFVSLLLRFLIVFLHSWQVLFKFLQQRVDCLFVLFCQMRYHFFLALLHLLLVSDEHLQLFLFKLQFFLVQLLQLLLILRVRDLHFLHLLRVFVFLLSLT